MSSQDDTEPTLSDLDLSSDPDLEAIGDPSQIDGAPTSSDLSDPDVAGELDPEQAIDLPDDDADGDAA